MSQCPTCGKELLDSAHFCGGCGKELSHPPVVISCPACQTSNPGSSRFCSGCGQPIAFKNPGPLQQTDQHPVIHTTEALESGGDPSSEETTPEESLPTKGVSLVAKLGGWLAVYLLLNAGLWVFWKIHYSAERTQEQTLSANIAKDKSIVADMEKESAAQDSQAGLLLSKLNAAKADLEKIKKKGQLSKDQSTYVFESDGDVKAFNSAQAQLKAVSSDIDSQSKAWDALKAAYDQQIDKVNSEVDKYNALPPMDEWYLIPRHF